MQLLGRAGILAMMTLAGVALSPLPAKATLLVLPDTWTGGTPAPGETVSQTFTSGGQTVTMSVNNNGSATTGATWSSGYPGFDSTHCTGGFTGQVGLQLVATNEVTNGFILTKVSFATPVTNLSFQIWDVDSRAGQFIDTIANIKALSDQGLVLGASSVTSEVAGYSVITGSGLGVTINGIATADNTTNQGTIDISFDGPITEFSFEWSNTDPGLGAQAIALGNIDFTIVPEANAFWPVVALSVLAGGVRLTQRIRRETQRA